MKLLFVGDPHFEAHDLDDCRALADLIVQVAKDNDAAVLFAGDQYHTHAVINAEVQYFWWETFHRLRNHEVYALVGNHDRPGSSSSKATAMIAHVKQCRVVDEPLEVNGVLLMPYMADHNEFVRICEEDKQYSKTVICHQTFSGSKYENGFYAEDGINPDLISQNIISGHIHTPQEFGKVWYPGAPRWRIQTDANTERAIWLLEFDKGVLINRTPFDTGKVCRKIHHLVDTQEAPATPPTPDPKDEYRVDLKGEAAWIKEREPLYKGWAKIRVFKTDRAQIKVKESDGISVAFNKWVEAYKPVNQTPTETLKKLVQERVTYGR